MTLHALGAELDRWSAQGQRATLWWRDDDAGVASAALHRLLALASAHGVPVALAVIPANLHEDAVTSIAAYARCAVLQHGVAHRNHAPEGEKRSELGAHRGLHAVTHDLVTARGLLASAFPDQLLPVVVPPWNRIATEVVEALPRFGYCGVSTFGPRAGAPGIPGLVQCNTHVDPIAWRADRSFVGEAKAAADLAGHLAARRERRVDATEPTGLLTHHLDFDDTAWQFVDRLLSMTLRHRAAEWIGAAAAFASRSCPTSGRSA